MLITDKFSSNTIEEIAKILGETLTGGEIARFLRESNITEIDCLSTTKWRRLNAGFLGSQISLQNASAICSCIENILSPIRFVSRQDNFEEYQKAINVVLAFEGLMLSLEGRLSPRPKVATLTEAQRREKRLHEKLVQRGAHDNIFKYCRAELLEENYFHSIFEAAKSIFDRLRELTGLEQDGAKLIDTVFSIDRPLLVINGLCTDSEKSEHKGFATLLKGIYGTFRNPFAHAAKIKWATSETDALDILSTISFVHRRLDEAQKTCFASIS